MMLMRGSRGVTLVELLVVLVLLGLIAGVVGLAAPPRRQSPPATGEVAAARRQAEATGMAVQVIVQVAGKPVTLRALPDGRLVGGAELGIDPLTRHE
jgi:prepilin-type N-terminal cleavage/methylation domain-containing protein